MFYGNKLIIQYNKVIVNEMFLCVASKCHISLIWKAEKYYSLIYPLHGKKHVYQGSLKLYLFKLQRE